MIKLIFIDVDNTILDFDEYVRQTMKEGFKHFSLKPFEPYMYDIFTSENNKLWESLERKELTFSELIKIRWNVILKKLGIDFDGVEFEKYFQASLNESAILIDGSLELLKYLSKKYTLAVASNGPYYQQTHRLELAGADKYFKYFFISEDLGASKPSKAFFDKAFEVINKDEEILPEETLIIGDSFTSDINGALEYGIKTCLFQKNHKNNHPDIDYRVDSLKEIIDIL